MVRLSWLLLLLLQWYNFSGLANLAFSHRVLVTGFGPFERFATNPTQLLAEALNGTCAEAVPVLIDHEVVADINLCFDALVLPVNRTGALATTELLRSELERGSPLKWSFLLHMGLEDVAKGLKLEVAAANLLASEMNLTKEEQPPAIPGAPFVLPTTQNLNYFTLHDLPAVRSSLGYVGDEASEPLLPGQKAIELWSRNPGRYFCNEVYFRSLWMVRDTPVRSSMGRLLPTLFVHVPNTTTDALSTDLHVIHEIVAHGIWAVYERDRRFLALADADNTWQGHSLVAALFIGALGGGFVMRTLAWHTSVRHEIGTPLLG